MKISKEVIDELKDICYKISAGMDDLDDKIEELQNTVKVSEETEDFLFELQDNEDIPMEIRDKDGELWKQI